MNVINNTLTVYSFYVFVSKCTFRVPSPPAITYLNPRSFFNKTVWCNRAIWSDKPFRMFFLSVLSHGCPHLAVVSTNFAVTINCKASGIVSPSSAGRRLSVSVGPRTSSRLGHFVSTNCLRFRPVDLFACNFLLSVDRFSYCTLHLGVFLIVHFYYY